MSVTVERRRSLQELPLLSQPPLTNMTVDDTPPVNSHCSQQDNCNHNNRLSVDCHHSNRDQELHTCDRRTCSSGDDHPMSTDTMASHQQLRERSMPLHLESSNERSQPTSQLCKQLPLGSPPSHALGLKEEEEEVTGDPGSKGKAPHTAKPVPLQLSEIHTSPTLSDSLASRTPPISNTARSRRLLLKSHSVGSIGSVGASSESLTMSSLLDACSYDTVTAFLSSLGFDDFESPELIPDRFISHEAECAKPSLMRQATLGSLPLSLELPDDVPLGATAETVVVHEPLEPESSAEHDLLPAQPDKLVPPQTLAIYNPSNSQIPWEPASLETVPEETASDLVSPRRSPYPSPHHSVDYTPTQDHPTEHEVSQGMLGANLAQRLRHHSLSPQREARRHSLLSLGESEGSTVYCSVASHLEDLDREEEEKRGASPMAPEEGLQEADSGRRRRRAHYAPPPQLLTWLRSAESLHEDSEEQPWPFSESPHSQVQRSLSDIQPSDISIPFPPHNSSSSIPTSPPHSSSLPQIALQSNSSNNCNRSSQTRLKLRQARFSTPASLKRREKLYLQAEMMSLYYGLQDARLDEKGLKAKVKGLNDCLSSAYQRSESPEPT